MTELEHWHDRAVAAEAERDRLRAHTCPPSVYRDSLEYLKAENERLREALKRIAAFERQYGNGWHPTSEATIARAALAPENQETSEDVMLRVRTERGQHGTPERCPTCGDVVAELVCPDPWHACACPPGVGGSDDCPTHWR